MQVTTIGLDIAKNVFQVHGIDTAEKVRAALTKTSKSPYCLLWAIDSLLAIGNSGLRQTRCKFAGD